MNRLVNSEMRPIRILLVEDSEDMLFLMKTEMEWLGYQVFVANDAACGLELARNECPDVIISDIQMPGIDGFEFIRRIRALKPLSSVPAIALTGFGREEDIEEALAQGFDAHVTKPVAPNELAALVQRLTRPRKLRKAS